MKIIALKERALNEARTAITPDTTKLFVKKGFSVLVEKNLGILSNFSNEDYLAAGAKVLNDPREIIPEADIILIIQPTPLENKDNEIELAKPGAIIIGLLSPPTNNLYLLNLAKNKLSAIAMELLSRVNKAQTMDVLSSQSNLADYRTVCYHFSYAFSMMITAAVTIPPCKIIILGIAGYAIRTDTKEQVESLGSKCVSPDLSKDLQNISGYTNECSNSYQAKQEEFLFSILKKYDIVITTAQIPGKRAPV